MISDQGKECTHMLLCIEKRSIIVFFCCYSLRQRKEEKGRSQGNEMALVTKIKSTSE